MIQEDLFKWEDFFILEKVYIYQRRHMVFSRLHGWEIIEILRAKWADNYKVTNKKIQSTSVLSSQFLHEKGSYDRFKLNLVWRSFFQERTVTNALLHKGSAKPVQLSFTLLPMSKPEPWHKLVNYQCQTSVHNLVSYWCQTNGHNLSLYASTRTKLLFRSNQSGVSILSEYISRC